VEVRTIWRTLIAVVKAAALGVTVAAIIVFVGFSLLVVLSALA
jgi:hypothetical protein